MHKFGEGNVERDPEDPQGVPVVEEGLPKEGAGRHSAGQLDQDLQTENDQADATPVDENPER